MGNFKVIMEDESFFISWKKTKSWRGLYLVKEVNLISEVHSDFSIVFGCGYKGTFREDSNHGSYLKRASFSKRIQNWTCIVKIDSSIDLWTCNKMWNFIWNLQNLQNVFECYPILTTFKIYKLPFHLHLGKITQKVKITSKCFWTYQCFKLHNYI